MSPTQREYVAFRIAKAHETLDEARLMFDHHHLSATVNRTYYACFYAVSALLFAENLSSSKHSGVLSLFDREWMRTGRLPAEMGGFYHLLFDSRQKGDYGDLVTFESGDVAAWLEDARNFVERVSLMIDTLASDQEGVQP